MVIVKTLLQSFLQLLGVGVLSAVFVIAATGPSLARENHSGGDRGSYGHGGHGGHGSYGRHGYSRGHGSYGRHGYSRGHGSYGRHGYSGGHGYGGHRYFGRHGYSGGHGYFGYPGYAYFGGVASGYVTRSLFQPYWYPRHYSARSVYVTRPQVTIIQAPATSIQNSSNQGLKSCLQEREYQTTVIVGGREVGAYGTACLQPDGSWLRGPAKLPPRYQ